LLQEFHDALQRQADEIRELKAQAHEPR